MLALPYFLSDAGPTAALALCAPGITGPRTGTPTGIRKSPRCLVVRAGHILLHFGPRVSNRCDVPSRTEKSAPESRESGRDSTPSEDAARPWGKLGCRTSPTQAIAFFVTRIRRTFAGPRRAPSCWSSPEDAELRLDYRRPYGDAMLTRWRRLRSAGALVNCIERRYEVTEADGSMRERIDVEELVRPLAPDALRAIVVAAGFVAEREWRDYCTRATSEGAQFFTLEARPPGPSWRQATARAAAVARRPGPHSSVARQDREQAREEGVHHRHVLAREPGRALVGSLAFRGNEPGPELDLGLRRIHQPRIAEATHAAQALLRHRGSDGAGRCASATGVGCHIGQRLNVGTTCGLRWRAIRGRDGPRCAARRERRPGR